MSTESNDVKETDKKEQEVNHKPVQNEPQKVREAEHKLKEMIRKAKERKTAQNTSRKQKGLSEINYFWLVIGGLGALGVGYLIFGNKEHQPEATRPKKQRYKFVPASRPKTPEKDTTPVKEEEPSPTFELNCF